jgi:CRP/FNR family transcriptional regulator, cyclic AMP receptor protein
VTADGVVLRLRLTHELLGQLVGAKRPTVSLALKELEARGSIHRPAEGGWLLAEPWSADDAADAAGEEDGRDPAPEVSRRTRTAVRAP